MISGRCLCGAHRYELEGPLELSHHCHCRLCQKQHGAAFETVVGVAPERLRWTRGETIDFESSPGFTRQSCATCGSPLPQQPAGLPIFVPAGCLDDLSERIGFHIFTASKAPWYEIRDGLPEFEKFPPGVDSEGVETRPPLDPPGGVRGSCLCGQVRWLLEGESITARHCHCQRCRRARGAAHASNGVHRSDGIRFTAGEERIHRYRVPEARFFAQCFCGACGGKVPVVDPQREIAIVPLGALDDPPPILPREHIWTASIPAWSGIFDDLPRHEGPPA